MSTNLIRPVILSGGSGTRLWPLSTPDRPKQLLALTDELTMLQLTARRVQGIAGFLPPMIIANARHEAEIRRQLAAIDIEDFSLILEPAGRNTAAAIALAALRSSPEELLLVMPSDHVIRDVQGFRNKVVVASAAAQQGFLLTFGIAPSGPETGYGYIRKGAELAPFVCQAAQFVEKPDRETAERYLSTGEYVWNAGIFLFRAKEYLAALHLHAPDVLAACEAATKAGEEANHGFWPDPQAFARSPSISVDYAVMEKAKRVAVVPLDIGWSDIGSWDALYEYLADGSGGAIAGDGVIQIDCIRSMARSDGPLVATIGLSDVVVVATQDAVLVMKRGESQRVREVIDRMG